jgi:lysophospholipase L1-like esterase
MSERKPSKAVQISAAVFAFLLFILLPLECLLRFLPPPRYNVNWIYDSVLGHRGPRDRIVHLPIAVNTQYNAYGYRGDDPTPRSIRKDHFSVFALGDSITEAIQVPWRRSYAKRLEYLLNEKLGRDSEVTAWAVSDYGTANELLAYAREARQLQPDVVLLQFLGLNDFVNNGLGFAGKNKAMSDFSRPYLIPRRLEGQHQEFFPLGAGGLKFTYLNPTWKSWRESIRLLNYVDFFWTVLHWGKKREILAEQPSTDFCATEVEVFLDEPDERWLDAFEVTGRLAEALQNQVDHSESSTPGSPPRLIAFYAPSYFEVYDPAWERGVELSLLRCFQKSYHRENPERRFLELMKNAGVEAYSLKNAFKNSKVPLQKLYLPDGHFSAEGHRVAAEALLKIISTPGSGAPASNSRQR